MRYFGIEMEGKFRIQKVNALPTYDFDRDEGRLVYNLTDNKFYYGDNDKWNRLADADIIIGGQDGLMGGGTLGDDSIVLTPEYGTTANTICQGNDSRLSNSREWSAPTVTEQEATAGTSTARRAWSPLRVRQAVNAVSDSTLIGQYVFVQDNLTGAEIPLIENYIKLTANLIGTGQYNHGKLMSQTLTGSDPVLVATAVIADTQSPMYNQTIHLINTENRYLAPGTNTGNTANDQIQQIYGKFFTTTRNQDTNDSGPFTHVRTNGKVSPGDSGSRREYTFDASRTVRTGTHTNVKRIEVSAYMRIK